MFGWRITKYDPKNRDDQGAYEGAGWTSSADIGCAFGGRVLDREGYLRMETAYVEAAKHFIRDAGSELLTVLDLEVHDVASHILGVQLDDVLCGGEVSLNEGDEVRHDALDRVCRLNLREIIWCKLEAERGRFYIHFGYDFYMYIGSMNSSPDAIRSAEASGLFVEPMLSPYL